MGVTLDTIPLHYVLLKIFWSNLFLWWFILLGDKKEYLFQRAETKETVLLSFPKYFKKDTSLMWRWVLSEQWNFRCTRAEDFFLGRVVMTAQEMQRWLLARHAQGALGFSEVELCVSGVFKPSPQAISCCWLFSRLFLPPYFCQAETSCGCLIRRSVCGAVFEHKAICDRLYGAITAGSLTSH